ncbi:MAG: efflux RND transporter periplasmic adaptor subunit [Gemmatimonadota bacterium]|nr:efflux RND transporter periplasmic adaptor subunit [Gemmatimonadota bacterium]
MRQIGMVGACLALAACGNGAATPAAGGAGGRGPQGPVPVEVVVAWADTVVDAVAATGQVEAMQSIELRPEVDGRIVEILVREGGPVAQGAALFRIDDQELKAQVARAEATRDLARQGAERTRSLAAERASTTAELERTEASLRSAQADLDLLSLRLARTVVRAPFTGVAGQRLVSLGDYVNSSSRMVVLQTVDPQRASFQVAERFAEQLALGQIVDFRVAALPGREFRGVVDFVDPVVQLPGRTITIKARVANPRRELSAGMFIEARLVVATRPDATVVPEDAIQPLQGTNAVWIVADGKVTRREIELGVRTPGFVEVRGVQPGEQVVVSGGERLQNGGAVVVTVVERRQVSGREPVQ